MVHSVEGGRAVALSFLASGFVDRAIIIASPIVFTKPVPSGIDEVVLCSSSCLELPHEFELEGGNVHCYSKRDLPGQIASLLFGIKE
jgi:riboflavin biosynthesis pyrimidine reductase